MSLTTDEAYELLLRCEFEDSKSRGYIAAGEEFDRAKAEETTDGWSEWGYNLTSAVEFDGYTIQCVEDFGGEGQGETRYVVFDIDGELFRKDGYYASHYGTDWDGDFRKVHAVQKTVTVYE